MATRKTLNYVVGMAGFMLGGGMTGVDFAKVLTAVSRSDAMWAGIGTAIFSAVTISSLLFLKRELRE